MWATVGCAEVLRYLGNGFIGALRLALWPRHRPLRVERICVYRIGAIGDLVCATPALFAIRRAYPEARLTLLTTPGNYSRARHAEELLGGAGWIDEVISYDLDQVRTMKDRVAFGRKLRARKFEVWFDLTLDRARLTRMLRDMVLARLLGARWAFGWRLEHLGFAARAEAEMREFPDEVERLAAVLRSSGIDDDATIFLRSQASLPTTRCAPYLMRPRGNGGRSSSLRRALGGRAICGQPTDLPRCAPISQVKASRCFCSGARLSTRCAKRYVAEAA